MLSEHKTNTTYTSSSSALINKITTSTMNETIINACIDEEKATKDYTYGLQCRGLKNVLTAVEEKKPLSIELIKDFHKKFSVEPKEITFYMSPEFREKLEHQNKPGIFRNEILGTTPFEKFSETGILEILEIIKSEAKDKFPMYKGTWIGPIDDNTRTLSFDESIHHSVLNEKQQNVSDKEFAKQLHSKAIKRDYVMLFA